MGLFGPTDPLSGDFAFNRSSYPEAQAEANRYSKKDQYHEEIVLEALYTFSPASYGLFRFRVFIIVHAHFFYFIVLLRLVIELLPIH